MRKRPKTLDPKYPLKGFRVLPAPTNSFIELHRENYGEKK